MAAPRLRFTRMTAVYPRGHFLQWTIDDATESGAYVFDLARAGGPDGPWELLARGLADRYGYLDAFPQPAGTDADAYLRPNQLRLFRNFYYRVQALTPSGRLLTAVDEVGPAVGGPDAPLAARKMAQYHRRAARNFDLALRKFVGTPVALLKRRVWGTRCKECWDRVTKEVIRPNCTACWGTGFEGGYWTPTAAHARRSAGSTSTQITPQQKSDANEATVWLPDTPAMERDDVVVFLEDQKRFRIDRQVQTEIRLAAVHQVFTCQEYDHSHVIYRYPVRRDQLAPLF